MKKSSQKILLCAGAIALASLLGGSFAGCAATASHESTGEYVDDATITTKVKSDLVADPVTKAREIKVETYRGVVQLSGFVSTSEERDRAATIARSVGGVRDVTNNIELKPSANP